jgi:hypothetical protein
MSISAEQIAFYTSPARMTDPGAADALLKDAPRDVPGIVRYVQNLLLHVHWAHAYRMRLTAERRDETNIRSLADMLALLQRMDGRPLGDTRTLYQRMVGNCRHFSVFAVALLRRAGIPARARTGFGAYFNPGTFEDHWVAEYWNGAAWQLFDAQIDAAQRSMLRLQFDTLNVPRDQFVIAGDAWVRCRDGRADPKAFGIFDMRGLWFIAGNVLRDLASLNNQEMLPWDCWGPMAASDTQFPPEKLSQFDQLAALTLDCDRRFAELRALYDNDASLRVPAEVFNADRNRLEKV